MFSRNGLAQYYRFNLLRSRPTRGRQDQVTPTTQVLDVDFLLLVYVLRGGSLLGSVPTMNGCLSPQTDTKDQLRIWRNFQIGKLLDLTMLDTHIIALVSLAISGNMDLSD